MELKQPTVFKTLEELKEAVQFNYLHKDYLSEYDSIRYTTPTVFWDNPTKVGTLNHQPIPEIQWDKSNDYLEVLQTSIMWSDIREQHRPKEWYELKENIGKLVALKDKERDSWYYDLLMEYDPESNYPFKTSSERWEEVRLIDPDELAKVMGTSNDK